jgi:hypothetical protein
MMPNGLPAEARSKLSELQLQRLAAQDAVSSAHARRNGLPRDADQQLRDGLDREIDKQRERHNKLSQLVHKLNQFVVELRLPPGGTLEPAPAINGIKLGPDETLQDALSKVREEIAACSQHLAAVKTAPLPLEDQQQLVEDFIARQHSAARPTVAVVGDRLRVTFRDSVIASTDDAVSLLCVFAPDQVFKMLTLALREQPVRADAMPAAERIRRTAELEAQLLELELLEEALIMRAHGDGVDVLRRVDAAPAAVLGVVVAKMEMKVA